MFKLGMAINEVQISHVHSDYCSFKDGIQYTIMFMYNGICDEKKPNFLLLPRNSGIYGFQGVFWPQRVLSPPWKENKI